MPTIRRVTTAATAFLEAPARAPIARIAVIGALMITLGGCATVQSIIDALLRPSEAEPTVALARHTTAEPAPATEEAVADSNAARVSKIEPAVGGHIAARESIADKPARRIALPHGVDVTRTDLAPIVFSVIMP